MSPAKKCLVACLCSLLSLFSFTLHADEGMWLPMLLEQLNQSDMQMKGFKLTAQDVYSVNHTSMKDAVVQFGGGCTAELISGKGLLLTNHHCGFGQIQSHSTVDHDYLTDGFWAKKQSEELPNPGLTVTFIIRMEDVTEKALRNVNNSMSETVRDSLIRKNNGAIAKEAVKGTHYESFIRPFYNGNQYLLFITETFRDIRLVGAPPSSIGKFGADADNWVWPRHTADFSMFRIYAGKNNEPADYAADNVPYSPRYFFPVSLKGEKEGDFTMVYGFPGRTMEYICSDALSLIQNVSDPAKVSIRDTRLSIMDKDMHESNKVRIQYAAKQSNVANSWKKWSGEMYGLERNKAIQRKLEYEKEFQKRVDQDPGRFAAYATILPRLHIAYDSMKSVQLNFDYFNEVAGGIEAVKYASGFETLVKLSLKPKPDQAEVQKQAQIHNASVAGYFKDYNLPTDEKICSALLKMYSDYIPKDQQPDIFRKIEAKYKGDFNKYANELYGKSMFASQDKMTRFLKNYKAADVKKIRKDPMYILMRSMYDLYFARIYPAWSRQNEHLALLNRMYMKAQMEVMTERKYYPDANLTLRVAYGKVGPYAPRDGVVYNWYTTLDGVMQKEDPNVDEFHVSSRLKELWKKKDYGQYADASGEMHVAFIANNHTSGGNSGSPVIDANGNLIGLNFDRDWEGTMSDEAFDPSFCRNISVDIRYVLFVVDKFAEAGYLVDEMKLVR
jgi:hypothetical protein